MGYPVIHAPNIHDSVGVREVMRSLKDMDNTVGVFIISKACWERSYGNSENIYRWRLSE